MTVLLGGRVAEQVVFGAITTGASDDLKRVAEIAHAMVHDYAMGNAGVGRSPDGDVQLSETTLRIRDEERQELIEEARRAAQRLIVAHRAQLDALAAELLEREVLERDAIERIMAGVPRMERTPGVGLRVVAAASAGRASPGPRRVPLPGAPNAAPRRRIDSGGVFQRIDHIGVAVEELEPALELYRDALRHAGRAPRGRRASRASRRCCSTSARTTSSCSRRSAPTRRSAGSSRSTAPACTTSPTRSPTSTHARRAASAPACADRRAAAHRHPRLARRLPASARDRRRAHRDRRSRPPVRSALMAPGKQQHQHRLPGRPGARAARRPTSSSRRCTRRSATAAGTSSTARTGPCGSTSRRSSTCAPRATTSASASAL